MRRSPMWGRSLGIGIILGIFVAYMLLNLLVLGFFMDELLLEIYPDADPVQVFNSKILYYLGSMFMFRYYLQDVPAMSIKPYLTLPVSRRKIVHFLLGRTISSAYNLLPLLLVIPFAIMAVGPAYGQLAGIMWTLALVGLILCNNFLVMFIKRQSVKRSWVIPAVGVVLLMCVVGDTMGWLSAGVLSGDLIQFIFNQPLLGIIPMAIATGLYYLNYSLLLNHAYLEDFKKSRKKGVANGEFRLLNRFGELGRFLALDLRLLTRSERAKTMMFSLFFMPFYGLLFFTKGPIEEHIIASVFASILMTGFIMMTYGQFMFSWDSQHFDLLLSQNLSLTTFFKSKYVFFLMSCVLNLLFTLPYLYFGWQALAVVIAAAVYNAGISGHLLLFYTASNRKALDLNASSMFNYQGVGLNTFLLMLPLMVLPLLVVAPFTYYDQEMWGIALLGALGIAGLLSHKFLLNEAVKRFNQKRYLVASGFRK
ncbi:MAG: DUF5687 family protein [Bacteroidota bacterium]